MSYLKSGLVVTVVSAFLGTSLLAQSAAMSQIDGTVHDPSGSAVPGAQVTATQTDTGLVRSVESGPDGTYHLPSLPIGPYQIDVKADGFSTYVQSGVVLQVNTNSTVDITLKVGAVSDRVTVEAAAAMVETGSTAVGQVIDQQRVVDLPLNGRLATQLITLTGAAVTVPPANVGQLISSKNYPNEVSISVAGGPANGLTFTLDGASHNDPINNANVPLPFPDALQEFKVETSALPAQYGQHSGGAVNVVTKSGGNDFHGDAFEFLRNGDFNARDFFSTQRDTLRRNQFGGTLGGAIVKNKLFFFAGYQSTIQKSDASSGVSFEPTQAMLQGNFITITSPACNQGKQITLPAPFVDNTIAPSLLSAPALKMMTYFPPTSSPCGRTQYSQNSSSSEQLAVGKVDYQLSASHSVFIRYLPAHYTSPASYTNTPLSNINPGLDNMANSVVFGDTYIVNPQMVNAFRATFNRVVVHKAAVVNITAEDLGINMVPSTNTDNLNVTVTGALYSAGLQSHPAFAPTTTSQLADDLSIVRGAHQIQLGVNWIRPVQNATFANYASGQFNFTGQITGLPMADFLIGAPVSFQQSNLDIDSERDQYIGLYIQDNWRVTSRIKIIYGLRWEPFISASMTYGHATHFDPALFDQNVHSDVYPNAPAGVLFPGDAGFDTNNRPSNNHWNNFAPRLGISWDPKGDGRMVIRAAFGLLYDVPNTLFYFGNGATPPWGSSVAVANPSGGFANPWQNYPGGDPFPTILNKNVAFPTGGAYLTVPLDLHNTYLTQRNLTIERQVGSNWLLSASYLGNNTTHMWAAQALDPSVYLPGASCIINGKSYSPCSSVANTAQRQVLTLADPTNGRLISSVTALDDGATSTYNALLLSVQHRLASHFTVLGNYTWGHCIADPVTTLLNASYTNPNDRNFDRGNCGGIDIRHNVNISAVLQSPVYSNHIVRAIAGSWQLSPIFGFRTGSYFTATTGADNALNDVAGQRPNQILPDTACVSQRPNCWLSPSAFSAPAPGTFGSSGANSLLGPGYVQVDVSLSRRFTTFEKQSLEFRADAFNLLNHPNFSIPVTTLNSANFGQITSDITAAGNASGDPRILQLSLKYLF